MYKYIKIYINIYIYIYVYIYTHILFVHEFAIYRFCTRGVGCFLSFVHIPWQKVPSLVCTLDSYISFVDGSVLYLVYAREGAIYGLCMLLCLCVALSACP